MRRYEVIVIGGGHAGVEAAWAAANVLGVAGSVALVTIDPGKIGVMSCNPAIGGLAKGQLVREVDALHGLMGLATDATGIQFKMLNRSKGPAVWGPRAQCDKHAYAEAVRGMIAARGEIEVVAGTVERLVVERRVGGARITGVVVKGAEGAVELAAGAVVLTTGTFMRGLMHTGEERRAGGRFGEAAAVGISGALAEMGFELGRLKTGTPPRLQRGSIRWDELEPALGDEAGEVRPFSVLAGAARGAEGTELVGAAAGVVGAVTRFPVLEQVECRQTRTTAEAHEVIRANLHRAPLFSGQIEGVGPRYCPSIEDKVVRFGERDEHGVFLEPESLRDDWIYCNGISTSLPADVQERIVRAMPGCAGAVIYRYGYAVEYDMVRPHQIEATGRTKLVEGLYLAGQINGTSGYEEAAAQGLIAGLNAAREVMGKSAWTCGRDEGYLGVLMDDLITKTPVEPYRMFTSRAEHRLVLRADNAAERLTGTAAELGLVGGMSGLGADLARLRRAEHERRTAQIRELEARITAAKVDGEAVGRLLLRPEFGLEELQRAIAADDAGRFDRSVWDTVLAERKYGPYIEKQRIEIRRAAEQEQRRLPADVDYGAMAALRKEAREALMKFRPATYGQAGRLEGVTPADVTLLAVLVKKAGRGRDAE